LCYFLPFSLMMPAALCLMLLLLPDELLTKIIIHSIKDDPFSILLMRSPSFSNQD
jgi:hypothetical protein